MGEIKYRKQVSSEVIEEVREKICRLGRLTDLIVRPFLVYMGQLAPSIEESDYFDSVISMEELLDGKLS